jgi:hypothetical protein
VFEERLTQFSGIGKRASGACNVGVVRLISFDTGLI